MFLSVRSKIYKSSLRERLYCRYARMRLKNRDFTIICNNCWAWSVYGDLGLKFTTPTIGLFFYAPCYIKFLKNIKYYAQVQLAFKDESEYAVADELRKKIKRKYPIGVLDDIEIHFMHYKNEQEAFEKWNKRVKRINFDNLFIAFSDVDLCTVRLMQEFDALDFEHKVFFSAKNYPQIQSLVWLKAYAGFPHIGDITNQRWCYRKYFDVIKWLNG